MVAQPQQRRNTLHFFTSHSKDTALTLSLPFGYTGLIFCGAYLPLRRSCERSAMSPNGGAARAQATDRLFSRPVTQLHKDSYIILFLFDAPHLLLNDERLRLVDVSGFCG